MKAVVCGGHLTPAVALIEGLVKKKAKILFIGRKRAARERGESLEFKTISGMGIRFCPIVTGRFMVRVNLKYFFSLFKIPIGFFQSLFWLMSFSPDFVFSFGGYVSLPVVFASLVLGIPVFVHEQTKRLGLANRITARWAKMIFTSWEETKKTDKQFADKMKFSGNLLRESVFESRLRKKPKFLERLVYDRKKPVLFIMGGNLGAHKINEAVLGKLEKLLERFTLVHLTGNSSPFYDYERFKKIKKELAGVDKKRYFVASDVGVDEFCWILSKSDIAISRAGANTINELAYFGLPCILVPLQIAAMGEQEDNARRLEKIGMAVIVSEEKLSCQVLLGKVDYVLANIDRFKMKGEWAKKLVEKDAVGVVLRQIEKYEASKKNKAEI